MDARFCIPGWATDTTYEKNNIGDCGTSIIAFWIVSMTICIVRLICALKRGRTWNERWKAGLQHGRWPLAPIVSFLISILYANMFLMIGLNILNAWNGFSFTLLGLAFFLVSLDYIMSLLKLVRLGKKIIPMSVGDRGNHLNKFNKMGTVLFITQISTMLVGTIIFVIFCPLFPEEYRSFTSVTFGL
jgi:hypothetical protein